MFSLAIIIIIITGMGREIVDLSTCGKTLSDRRLYNVNTINSPKINMSFSLAVYRKIPHGSSIRTHETMIELNISTLVAILSHIWDL